ncbi:MAG: hypothetical protein WCF10_01325 [Polyangiales bacterium]
MSKHQPTGETMTRYNIFGMFISSGMFLAAIGCGDPSVDGRSILEEPAAVGASESGPDGSLEEELELACESACHDMSECPGMRVTVDCVESCVAAYAVGTEACYECALAGINLLNCYSALGCSLSMLGGESECADAESAASAACAAGELRAREVTESDRELVGEIHDTSFSDLDGDAEETGAADGSEDEATDVTDVTRPIVIVEVPDTVVNVDFR